MYFNQSKLQTFTDYKGRPRPSNSAAVVSEPSFAQSMVPTYFRRSMIIPVPKNKKLSCLNDYCPVALMPMLMKSFKRLLKDYKCSSFPSLFDSLVCLQTL